MEKYRFSGDKYMTAGIQNELPAVIMMYLWGIIEQKKRDKSFTMDYLQVFELKRNKVNDKEQLLIVHSQEMPEPYEKRYHLKNVPIVTGKIFVIDDISHVTMMWSREY